jgi:hypothetical protein
MQSSLCYLSNAACSWSSKRKGAFPTNCNRRRLPGSSFIKLQYESVSKSFRTGCLERELQMVQLPATRCNCIAILWVSLVSFVTITLSVASQRVIIFVVASQRGFIFVVVYFVIDSVRKLLDTPSYTRGRQVPTSYYARFKLSLYGCETWQFHIRADPLIIDEVWLEDTD